MKDRIFKTIIIENISENYVRDFSNCSETEKNFWNFYDGHYGNKDIFYEGDDKLIVSLLPIDIEYLKSICNLFGWKNVLNLFPKNKSLSTCEDIISDKNLCNKFIDAIKSNSKIRIIPLRHSKEFYSLIAHLRKINLKFTVPEVLPNEVEFFRDYYDTKHGFRILAEQTLFKTHLKVKIPKGYFVSNVKELTEAVHFLYLKVDTLIIKGNNGTQGDSILVLKKSENMQNTVNSLPWWNGQAVVEEYISSKKGDLLFSPSVECVIREDGKIEYLYSGYQLFEDHSNAYIGLYICPELSTSALIRDSINFAKKYGETLRSLGYKGYFDVDFIISNTKQVYAVESNLRRTGGTHIHYALKELLGSDYSKNNHCIGIELHTNAKTNYASMLNKFADLLYNKNKECGIIFVTPDMLEFGLIGLIIIHRSKKLLFETLNEIRKRISL